MINFKYFLLTFFVLFSNSLKAESALEQKCEFLCDLNEKTTSTIILVGEVHHSSPQRLQDALKKSACQGEIYLGLEGEKGKIEGIDLEATCPTRKKKVLIFGLENELSDNFVSALDSYFFLVYDLKHNNNYKRILERKLSFILSISPKGLVKSAWECTSQENEHKFPDFIALLDEYVDKYEQQNDIPVDFIKQKILANKNFMKNEAAFVQVAKDFARILGKKVQESSGFSDIEFGDFFDLVENPHDKDNQRKVADFAIKFRDIIMAQNLAKLYCKAQPTGKQVYAVVGKGHLPGIKAYLTDASKGKIEIQELDLEDLTNHYNG